MATLTVGSLWRYPVKSMAGEELARADATERGFLGDRAYGLVEASSGKLVSAKQAHKWATLLNWRAEFVEPPLAGRATPAVRFTAPDGKVVRSDDPDCHRVLSQALGREVKVAASGPSAGPMTVEYVDVSTGAEAVADFPASGGAPAGSFFDFATMHLVTTATLARLKDLYKEGRFDLRRFRPNIVIEHPGTEAFPENSWVGKKLSIGDVRADLTDPCPRCVMTTLAQGNLPADRNILKTVAHNPVLVPFMNKVAPSVGIYARVTRGGSIGRGDQIRIGD